MVSIASGWTDGSAPIEWCSRAGGAPGSVRVVRRPDGRVFLPWRGADGLSDVERSVPALDGVDVFTVIPAADAAEKAVTALGFGEHRREHVVRLATDSVTTGLPRRGVVPGVRVVRADRVAERRLRLLDDLLRQHVPGTDGWQWEAADFRDETYDPVCFDPTLYRVAFDVAAGDYVGLARVWKAPGTPRVGLVAVLPSHRCRGVARALLGRVLAAAHDQGIVQVEATIDDTNTASTALFAAAGGRRVGTSIEYVRPATRGPYGQPGP